MEFIDFIVNEKQFEVITEEDKDSGLTEQNEKKDVPDNVENNFQSAEEEGYSDNDIVTKRKNHHQG